MHHRVSGALRFLLQERPQLVAEWITSAGLPAGQATWTDTVGGLVLTETGTITTAASGGTNDWLVFPGTASNYMSKTDGTGALPVGDAERTVVLCGEFGTGRWCGFSWGDPTDFKAFTLGPQGTGDDAGAISADYYNAYAAADSDLVSSKGPGIWFLTLHSSGVVRLYHGDQLVMTDIDRLLDTGTSRINLMRPYGSGLPAAGNIGYVGVYDGVLGPTARQRIVDRLNPLYLGITDAPIATDVIFTANSPTTGTVTATLPTWRSVITGVITTSATKPSVGQINAGLDHLNATAVKFSAIATVADEAVEIGPIGLTPNATNYPHYYMKDAYGTVGTVQTGADDDTPPITIPTAITPAAITFSETVLSPFVLTTLTSDQPATFTKVSGEAAFTVSTTGIVTLTSDLAHGDYSFVARATNTAGTFDATIDVTVTVAAASANFSIRFGALTAAGAGGAQARDAAGFVVPFDSIEVQPSTRWTLASGRLVATGTPAMASEQITATVDGESVSLNITVVPNMISVKDSTEFAAVSMTPAGTGDFTIHLRAETVIPAATANSKIAGTSAASRRALGGTLTLTGELVRGAPSANIDGKFRPKFFSGGAFVFSNCKLTPSDSAVQAFTNSSANALIDCMNSPTTDVTLDGIHSIGNPGAIAWPGKTAAGGTNDWGLDTWGALIRVNAVSGVSRPYKDGQVTSGGTTGPDIVTFTGSGVKRVLMGIKSRGGGVFDLQVGDKVGNPHSVANNLVSGENTAKNILVGDTVSGLDGFAATVVAPPSGVDTAGGFYAGAAAFTYLIRGPRWMDSGAANQNSGTANTVRNLTIRNCRVVGCSEVVHPYAIVKVVVEQNVFGMFTEDCFKLGNPAGNPNFELVIRRNDFYGAMQSPTDLGGPHNDYLQIFGSNLTAYWKMQIHHNRILCNARGNGQGLWPFGDAPMYDSQVFGNILVLYNGGNASSMKFMSNCQAMHNTLLISAKEADLPINWAPGSGGSMTMNFSPISPATTIYSGWNAARRFNGTSILTEKNFGLIGNTTMDQDDLFVGLAASKPSRPWYFETYAELMVGAKTLLTGADDKVGALGSNSDWSGYPNYVTTDFSHIVHANFVAPTYDPGVPPTLELGAVTGTGGTESYTGTATVVTAGGAVYYVAYPSSATEPNATQIQAGTDGDNVAAADDGTVGSSTAGLKNISGSLAAGTYKISYVQVVGSNVSPVKTITEAITVVGAGITAVNQLFVYSDSVQAKTPIETSSFTPTVGQPLFIEMSGLNGSTHLRKLPFVVTIGTPGRASGDGAILTPIAGTYNFNVRATGAWFNIEASAVSATLSTLQVKFNDGTNDDSKWALAISGWQVDGAHQTSALGVVSNVGTLANGTTLDPAVTTGTNGSIVLYQGLATNPASGAHTVTVTGATSLRSVSTGGGTSGQDFTGFVAWEPAATAGTFTMNGTWTTASPRYASAIEVKAASGGPSGIGSMVIGSTFVVA